MDLSEILYVDISQSKTAFAQQSPKKGGSNMHNKNNYNNNAGKSNKYKNGNNQKNNKKEENKDK